MNTQETGGFAYHVLDGEWMAEPVMLAPTLLLTAARLPNALPAEGNGCRHMPLSRAPPQTYTTPEFGQWPTGYGPGVEEVCP